MMKYEGHCDIPAGGDSHPCPVGLSRQQGRWAGMASQCANYQLPITNYQLPITNYQLPITNYQLPITNYQLPITNYFAPNPRPLR
jgi:hypothetical protein